MYPGKYELDIGDVVRLPEAPKRFYKVIWRGKVKCIEGAFAYVYQLNDGHWDCYYSQQLWTINGGVRARS